MSYFEHYSKPIEESTKKRISCRTYEDRLLTSKDKDELLSFSKLMSKGLWGETVRYQLVESTVEQLKAKRIAGYGFFKNARSFMAGIIDISEAHNISYGYVTEHIVLKATEIGLGTCWAGYFDPYLIKDVAVRENQVVPAVCVVGYAAQKQTFKERAARFAIRASKRQNWERLFFYGDFETKLTPETAGPYAEALEFCRLAPSARNTQPWRVVKDRQHDIFHFFKQIINKNYESKKLHDIDIGIAMCHFELGAAKHKLSGKWERTEPNVPNIPKKTNYMISWTTKG